MARVGRRIVLPVRAAISTGHKKMEDMQGAWAEVKAGVAAETNKNSNEKIRSICKQGLKNP